MDAKKRPQDDALKSAPIPEENAGNADEEAGRRESGTTGSAKRPTGAHTARDVTGVDPQDPITRPDDEQSG